MNHKEGDILSFIQSKDFKYIKSIGQGGTGQTILLKDEITEFEFVCKKYVPIQEEYRNQFFQRFIEEIKIMYPLYHKNIVRIYNYFLYPNYKTGYILMEYVIGTNIRDYLFHKATTEFENLFLELIEAFKYLEENKVLHRDIRPSNILVTEQGHIKLIDFGFGKKLSNTNIDEQASIILNWPVTDLPSEILHEIYNHQSEIYFLGKMYIKLLNEYSITDFKYDNILIKMTQFNSSERYQSFREIEENIYQEKMLDNPFSENEKVIYQDFADSIMDIITSVINNYNIIDDIIEVNKRLDEILHNCFLEDTLQNNSALISCFMSNKFLFNEEKIIPTSLIKKFIKLYSSTTDDNKRILLNGLIARFKTIPIYYYADDDLPF